MDPNMEYVGRDENGSMANDKKGDNNKGAATESKKTAETTAQAQKGTTPAEKAVDGAKVGEVVAPSEKGTEETKANKAAAAAVAKASKMEALKKAAVASRERAITDSMNKLDLFDSTKASDWKTTGVSAPRSIARQQGRGLPH
ncbi:MAG: hypothetical protein M1832_006165 [Thelocarpon impressellum]|nr:MAG: hypothetical protein M1832_006165 [Thelocarpon impressellum]